MRCSHTMRLVLVHFLDHMKRAATGKIFLHITLAIPFPGIEFWRKYCIAARIIAISTPWDCLLMVFCNEALQIHSYYNSTRNRNKKTPIADVGKLKNCAIYIPNGWLISSAREKLRALAMGRKYLCGQSRIICVSTPFLLSKWHKISERTFTAHSLHVILLFIFADIKCRQWKCKSALAHLWEDSRA